MFPDKDNPEQGSREGKPVFLSAAQVAARYGQKRKWVYGCKQLQDISIKIGKFLFYRLEDIEVFEARRTEPKHGFALMLMRQKHQSVLLADETKRTYPVIRNNKLAKGRK